MAAVQWVARTRAMPTKSSKMPRMRLVAGLSAITLLVVYNVSFSATLTGAGSSRASMLTSSASSRQADRQLQAQLAQARRQVMREQASAEAAAKPRAEPAVVITEEADAPSTSEAVVAVAENLGNSLLDGANAAAAAVQRVGDQLRAAAGNSPCVPSAPNWPPRPLNWITPLESAAWPVNCEEALGDAAAGAAMCAELRRVAQGREVLLVPDTGMALDDFMARAAAAQVAGRVLFAAASEAALGAARVLGAGGFVLPAALAALPPSQRKWAAVGGVLATGCSVLLAEADTQLHDTPFPYVHRDSDLEAVSTVSGGLSRGRVVSVDDAQMGWSRYAQSLAIAALNPKLLFAAATPEARELARAVRARLAASPGASERFALTDAAIAPAHDGATRAGASVRVLAEGCFGTDRGSVARAAGGAAGAQAHPNAVLESREFLQRPQVLRQGCATVPPAAGEPRPRPLNWVVPRDAPWPPADVCRETGVEALCEVVGRIAIRREVLAAVSNKNIFHMLQLFVNGGKAANVTNLMVVALDEPTAAWLTTRRVAHYTKKIVSRTGSTDNHATSGLKFKILLDFLRIGCSVLLSDVDVIWLANPFPHLYRDSDVEGMSDGWDTPTAYGYDYGGGALRVFARNSGMFYLQATREAESMMRRLAHRMETEGTWDQTAYNEEQFYPSMGAHGAVGVTSRVMNYYCNLNSKTFFRFLRDDAELLGGFRPLSAHVNYHPEKPQRMVDLHAFYYDGDKQGIWKWNGGEGSRLQAECKAARAGGGANSALVARVRNAGKAEWGGIKHLEFFDGGALKTPWGRGTWGDATTAKTPDTIFAEFIGQTHLLRFAAASDEFTFTRCSDGEKGSGKLA